MNTDILNSMHPHHAVDTAYMAVTAVQDRRPEHQVAGVAALFLAMCQGLNLNVPDTLAKADAMLKHDDNHYQCEVRALRAYVEGELA